MLSRLYKPIVVAFCVILLLLSQYLKSTSKATILPGYYKVTQVFDGDTIEINMNGVLEKVRFIGVDTPETHKPDNPPQCYGQEATKYTKQSLSNMQVRLEADYKSSNRDKYERLLRYVYDSNGNLINKSLIENGYGFAIRSFEHSKRAEFVDIESNARNLKKGLWTACEVNLKGYYHTNNL